MRLLCYGLWAALAGAFIPAMAVLNSRLGRTLGAPEHAVVMLFAVGLSVATLYGLLSTGRLPTFATWGHALPQDFLGGVIVAFYILSVTLLVPRFGLVNTILCVMTSQIISAAVIDHFGLFGATGRPMTALKVAGVALLLSGLMVTQTADRRATARAPVETKASPDLKGVEGSS